MAISIGSRLKGAWNAFLNKDPTQNFKIETGPGSYYRPDRLRLSRGSERTIVAAIYNRIALDIAAIDIKHVQLDENGRYLTDMNSDLNNCLTLEANIDQTNRAFMQDLVLSMFDEGVVAIVPVDTTSNPNTGAFDVETMRTGRITQWYPRHVKIEVYDDRSGQKKEITMAKEAVAIIENPLYAVINEPNSTMHRLVRKLSLLDTVDEQNSSGKLDLIIQLPYVIKTEARRQQAEERRKLIEKQLSGSKYGIAYTDGTEKITQLNRAIENQLFSQVEYLTRMLYSQLGITEEILNGTANNEAMTNYYSRTIEPILSAIALEMKRKFLTPNARTRGQSIEFFRDPFTLVPVSQVAEMADKFTRNEIMTSNEFRQVVGLKPSSDPKADELRNKNLSEPAGAEEPYQDEYGEYPDEGYEQS